MLTKKFSQQQNTLGARAQALVEFAIALPVLLALLVGIFEVGRMVFVYTAVTNASREAVRYASAVGTDDDGLNHYNNCSGIRNTARRSAYFMDLQDGDIAIMYDAGPGTSMTTAICDGSDQVDTGDRVIVTVNADYSPMVNLLPIGSRTFTSSSARTILGIYELGPVPMKTSTASAPSNTPVGGIPTDTPTTAPSDTPTSTATSTPTNSGDWYTFTPLPTSTPTRTPTITPTFTPSNTPTITPTFTQTFTPTATSTPVPGCDSISHGQIVISGSTMSMTIANPHEAITVLNVQVVWNAATGGAGGTGSSLTLQSASLGGSTFWTGNDTTGNLTITPSSAITIPGNNATSTIIFTFNKAYKNPGTTSIVINLSTPGCESFPIQSP